MNSVARRKKKAASFVSWSIPALSLLFLLGFWSCTTQNLLVTDKTGSIFVNSSPPGANILLDHALTGKTTPDTLFGVEIGDHVVSVARKGYVPSPESLVIAVSESHTSAAEFVLSESSRGSLVVSSNVIGATICLNNVPTVEETPHMFFDRVPVGTHVVSVFKEGYANNEPTKEIVRIMPGDTTEVNFSLSPAEVGQAVGNITPDFELQADFGFLYRLYAYRGFVVMINFWAENCPNCMKELPYLQEIYDDYLPDTLVIFGLNYEDGFDVIQRIRDEKGLTFILLKDTDGAVKTDYGIVGTPVTIILDRGGKIYYYRQGFQDPSVAQWFRDKLDELFGR